MSMTIKIVATTALALAIAAPAASAQAASVQTGVAQTAVTQLGLASNAGASLAAPMLVATPVPEPPRTRKFRVGRAGVHKGTSVPQPPNKRRSAYRNNFNPGGKVGFNPQPEPPKIKNFKR